MMENLAIKCEKGVSGWVEFGLPNLSGPIKGADWKHPYHWELPW
jgi:hypothetical protein